jgi:hypothetical protein
MVVGFQGGRLRKVASYVGNTGIVSSICLHGISGNIFGIPGWGGT